MLLPNLLERKALSTTKTDGFTVAAGVGNTLGILFIALKLSNIISWSWLWVLLPFWIWLPVLAILLIAAVVVWTVLKVLED